MSVIGPVNGSSLVARSTCGCVFKSARMTDVFGTWGSIGIVDSYGDLATFMSGCQLFAYPHYISWSGLKFIRIRQQLANPHHYVAPKYSIGLRGSRRFPGLN